MNADIVFILCPYLDLRSLFCFAAACPKWSSIIHKHVEKKKLKLGVKLECDEEGERVQLSVDHDQCTKLNENGTAISNGSAVGYRQESTYNASYQRYEYRMVIELSSSFWNHVPFHVMDVSGVEINQTSWSTFSEDVYALLGKLPTPKLTLAFRRRDEARRILGTIIFKPRALVKLDERSKGIDKNPILRKDQLALFKRAEYSGEMGMLRNDLLSALDWYCTLLEGSNVSGTWLENSLKEYLEDGSSPIRCVRRCYGNKYEFEKLVDGKAVEWTSGPRKITVADYVFYADPFFSQEGMSFVVENFF